MKTLKYNRKERIPRQTLFGETPGLQKALRLDMEIISQKALVNRASAHYEEAFQ